MRKMHYEEHRHDADGNPAGGVTYGIGFTISWQNGPQEKLPKPVATRTADDPLGQRNWSRSPPNGALVEDVIAVAIGRLEFYEASRFACDFNKQALKHLAAAAAALDSRREDREDRDVEGTYQE